MSMNVNMSMGMGMHISEGTGGGEGASAWVALARLPPDWSERLAMLSLAPGLLGAVGSFYE